MQVFFRDNQSRLIWLYALFQSGNSPPELLWHHCPAQYIYHSRSPLVHRLTDTEQSNFLLEQFLTKIGNDL